MKQILRKIEITMVIFGLLAGLSIIEMTILDGTLKGGKTYYSADKNNSIYQNE